MVSKMTFWELLEKMRNIAVNELKGRFDDTLMTITIWLKVSLDILHELGLMEEFQHRLLREMTDIERELEK